MQTTDSPRQASHGRISTRMTRTLALLPWSLVVLALVVAALDPAPIPVLIALVLAVVAVLWGLVIARAGATAEDTMLIDLGAVEIDPDASLRMHNVVEGLCLTMGLNKPRMWVVSSGIPLALVVAGSGSPGSLVFSDGLLGSLDRVESEALAAHMLVRLRSGDAETVSTALALWRVSSRFGIGTLASLVLSRLARVEAVHLVDSAACRITRYPPALVSVLGRFDAGIGQGDPTDVPDRVRRLLGPLMVAEPGSGDAFRSADLPSLEPVRLSTGERIELLKEY